MGTRHLYWILTGPSFAVQKEMERDAQLIMENFTRMLC